MPEREHAVPAPEFRGLAWVRAKLRIDTHGELEQLTERVGRPVSRPTIVRMDGDFPGGDREYRPSVSSVLAVRDALELQRAEQFDAEHIIGGHPHVHLCLFARGFEPHFYWETGRWEQFTAGLSERRAMGLAAQVQRERQGLSRHQLAVISSRFGADWTVDAKTVKALELGGPCAWDSVYSVARALDVRADFRTGGWTNTFTVPPFDFEELVDVGTHPTRAQD